MCQTTSFEVDRIFGQIWSCPTWLVPSAWTRCTAGTCDWRLCESFIDSMATKVARVCWRGWPELHATMHNFLKRRYGRWWVRWQTDGYSGNWQSKWKGSLLYHEIVGVLCEYSRWLQLQRCLRANDRRVCTMDMGWAGDKDKVPCHMIFSWVSCLLVFEKFWTKSSGSQGVCSKGPVQNFLDGLIVPSMFVIQFFLLLAISLVLMPHASLGVGERLPGWWTVGFNPCWQDIPRTFIHPTCAAILIQWRCGIPHGLCQVQECKRKTEWHLLGQSEKHQTWQRPWISETDPQETGKLDMWSPGWWFHQRACAEGWGMLQGETRSTQESQEEEKKTCFQRRLQT